MPVVDGPREELAQAEGPINALEADRYVEDLRPFAFKEMGGPRWMTQHEFMTKLNVQAHVNASQARDEFVLEAIVLHEKMPLIIRELIASELWKQNGYPLIKGWLEKHNSIKGYLLLYHEGVLANLLEALMYHKQGCEAAGDLIVELVDYCHRKLMFLLNAPPPKRPADKEELKKQLLAEAQEEHSTEQEYSINMSCALCCLSIVRFLTDHIEALPLAVMARMLDTYDLLMVLCPLLELKPWQSDGADGEQRRFIQGHWARVPEAEVRKMAKAEAQCWLAVYNLVMTPTIRRRYQFNSFRKNVLLRVRKFLHESTVDQIPILTDLMRCLDEMLMQDPPSAAESRPAYVLEQLPELREQLSKEVDWKQVIETQKVEALNDSEEEKRAQAAQLAGVFDLDGMDELMAAETGAASDKASALRYYIQLSVTDDEGREAVSLLAESQDTELVPQGAYTISAEQKQLLIPASCRGTATVSASLNMGGATPAEVKGTLELQEGRKKQWLQLGFDPYGLRVQLHVLASPDGRGYHIIHARVTPPPPCILTITFTPQKGAGDGVRQVRAKGRGVAAQAAYEVDALDAGVRVPKLCSAAAKLTINVGGGDAEETVEAPNTELALSSSSQMLWRQLGADPSQLRVQIKLAPANGGGFALTHVRVTPPATYRTQGGASATKQHAAPSASAEAELATAQSEGPAVEEELRIEEVAPASGAAPSLPPKPTPASKTKADSDGVAAAQTDNEALFMPAAKFCGARAGYVFKRGKQGVGYYRDVAPAEQPGKKAVSFSGGNGASAATNSASPPPGPVDQASAAKKAAADALFAKGDAAGAANAYTELLSTMPPSTAIGHTALSNRSACHLALRDWSRCAEDCDEALTAARADLPARALVKLRLRRAEARLSMGLREMAAADVHEAERLRPSEDTTAKAQIEAFEERLKSATNPAVRANDVVGGRSAPPAKAKFDTVISGEAPNRTLTLNVPLPGVKSLADVTLELSNLSLNLLGEGVEIEAPLPFQVDSATASAKFSAKAGVLRIKAKESS